MLCELNLGGCGQMRYQILVHIVGLLPKMSISTVNKIKHKRRDSSGKKLKIFCPEEWLKILFTNVFNLIRRYRRRLDSGIICFRDANSFITGKTLGNTACAIHLLFFQERG